MKRQCKVFFAFYNFFVYNENGDHMKKKGFTLIELLGTLVVLSIVVVIAIPIVDNAIKQSRQKSYLAQLKGIESSARAWAADHTFEVPSSDGESKTLTLEELVQGGYAEKGIMDPKSGEAFVNITVKIEYQNHTLVYTVYDDGEAVEL